MPAKVRSEAPADRLARLRMTLASQGVLFEDISQTRVAQPDTDSAEVRSPRGQVCAAV
jgi:hypothetical protein